MDRPLRQPIRAFPSVGANGARSAEFAFEQLCGTQTPPFFGTTTILLSNVYCCDHFRMSLSDVRQRAVVLEKVASAGWPALQLFWVSVRSSGPTRRAKSPDGSGSAHARAHIGSTVVER